MFESYQKIDTNQPTLTFLHGGPGVVDHTLYEPFWSQISEMEVGDSTLQVIFIDHRGNGRSYQNVSKKEYGDSCKLNLTQWGKDVYEFLFL